MGELGILPRAHIDDLAFDKLGSPIGIAVSRALEYQEFSPPLLFAD